MNAPDVGSAGLPGLSRHVRVDGSGPDLVLLHGWGMHGGIWDAVADRLSADFRVHRPDLPGFGLNRELPSDYRLDTVTDCLLRAVPAPAVWLGWSLGGLLAMRAAMRAPQRVTALVLVASTPCFVSQPDWDAGMAPAMLQEFAGQLLEDHAATLNRFLSLQARGSDTARETMRQLRQELFRFGEPAAAALQGGLNLLRDTDLRGELGDIHVPVQLVHGERDMLAPVAAAKYLSARIPGARLEVLPGAGHAPFLSHPQEFIDSVARFLEHIYE
jgi:pimeloyl-[acyl-carrier protein] methyl ester esterase